MTEERNKLRAKKYRHLFYMYLLNIIIFIIIIFFYLFKTNNDHFFINQLCWIKRLLALYRDMQTIIK